MRHLTCRMQLPSPAQPNCAFGIKRCHNCCKNTRDGGDSYGLTRKAQLRFVCCIAHGACQEARGASGVFLSATCPRPSHQHKPPHARHHLLEQFGTKENKTPLRLSPVSRLRRASGAFSGASVKVATPQPTTTTASISNASNNVLHGWETITYPSLHR
mgnify:CR=1 FL=1